MSIQRPASQYGDSCITAEFFSAKDDSKVEEAFFGMMAKHKIFLQQKKHDCPFQ